MKKCFVRLFLGAVATVCMASFSLAATENAQEASAPVKTAEKKVSKKPFPGQENLLDINTATAEQLKALPGITDEDVQKIIAGRPYTRKNQLKQRHILSPSTYEGIRPSIVAKKAVR